MTPPPDAHPARFRSTADAGVARQAAAWRPATRRYVVTSALGNLAWELAELPLYTLWQTGSAREMASAAIHCSAGDLAIAGTALAGSLLLFGRADWPRSHFWRVAGATLSVGLGATILIERLSTAQGFWTYSERMPTLPLLGIGLAPVAQWVLIPLLALGSARLAVRRRGYA